jgi:hypothetical protein
MHTLRITDGKRDSNYVDMVCETLSELKHSQRRLLRSGALACDYLALHSKLPASSVLPAPLYPAICG